MATLDSAPAVETVTALQPLNDPLAIEQQREAGLNALARMSDAEFVERMKSLRLGLDRFDMLMGEVLTSGKHPGADLMLIDGVDKPILTLSGAEKTCFVARLAPSFLVERDNGLTAAPPIHYIVTCRLHLGNTGGPVIAEGVGSANSYEKKYRWRYAEKKCPECGVIGSVIRSKHQANRGPFLGQTPWFCWKKKGGCGIEFAETDERIIKQTLGMIENPDPFDLDNTLLKMAKKRAFVDATKTATASSGRVTVDLEEGQPGTAEANVLRDSILTRAAQIGFKTRGELWAVVKKATGIAVQNMQGFTDLTADQLSKVIEAMPKAETPPDHDAPFEPMPETEIGDPDTLFPGRVQE